VCFTSRKPKREEKSFLGGGSFFFAFFHEKFLWMGEFLGTQQLKSHNTSKITNHHLLVTSS
jgi:hypothetical protein